MPSVSSDDINLGRDILGYNSSTLKSIGGACDQHVSIIMSSRTVRRNYLFHLTQTFFRKLVFPEFGVVFP